MTKEFFFMRKIIRALHSYIYINWRPKYALKNTKWFVLSALWGLANC